MNTVIEETSSGGFSVICIGMGSVLLFLCLTIASMVIMSAVIRWLNTIYPEPQPAGAAAAGRRPQEAGSDEALAVAVLMAWLSEHGGTG